MKIVVCSGGTGGHMFPACALLEAIKQRKHHVHMVTDTRGETFCKDIADKTVLDTVRLSSGKAYRIMTDFSRIFLKFINLWKNDPPDAIVGFGGLFTVVPISVAKMFGAKVVIYEQNAIVGKANRLLSKISDLKLSTFEIGDGWRQIASPVRKEFIARNNPPYNCDGKIKIIVIGGSQGATSFSSIVPKALSKLSDPLKENIEIIQQVGSGKIDDLQNEYKKCGVKATLAKFIHNIAEEMTKAQLVICRSGASTLAELSALGRPAILIPYPSASENHQFHNAMYYKNKGAAWIVEENEATSQELSLIIIKILNDRELLKVAASNMINKSFCESTNVFVELIERLNVTR